MKTETRAQLERAWEDCLAATTTDREWIFILEGGRLLPETTHMAEHTSAKMVHRSADWAADILYALQQEGWLDATADEIDLFLHQKGV